MKIALLLGVLVLFRPDEGKTIGSWLVATQVDAFDDSKTCVMGAQAEEGNVTLGMHSDGTDAVIWLKFNRRLAYNDQTGETPIGMRVDKGEPSVAPWRIGSEKTTAIAPQSTVGIDKIRNASSLVIRAKTSTRSDITAVFELSENAAAFDAFEKCRATLRPES